MDTNINTSTVTNPTNNVEDPISIMIVTNSNYFHTTLTMLLSIFQSNLSDLINVYMLYSNLQESEIDSLQNFGNEYPGKAIIPIYIKAELTKHLLPKNEFPIEIYYRILGINLLPLDLDKILYLDVDLIVKKSIRQLYDTDVSDYAFGACEDIFGQINGLDIENHTRLSVPNDYKYFNSGVLLMNLEYLRQNDQVNNILQNIFDNFERYYYVDQDVLNELYQDRLMYLDWSLYNCTPSIYYIDRQAISKNSLHFLCYDEIRELINNNQFDINRYLNLSSQIYETASIIHYVGNSKPWRYDRKESTAYEIFDKCYYEVESQIREN